MCSILAIDPGTTQSGWVRYCGGKVLASGICDNERLLEDVRVADVGHVAIEMIASYGMPVGRETFETCVWIGRFWQVWEEASAKQPLLVYRKDAKLFLCGTTKAKDANIRQALLDLLGPAGTKKEPGPTYGVKSHAWAALAVAVTAEQQRR